MVENVIIGLRYAVTVFSVLAILGNLLMIAALVWTTKLRFKYFQLVFIMAVADMFFAAFCTAFPWTDYHIIYSLFMTGYVVSVLLSLAIAINRYLAFSHTRNSQSRYDSLFTKCRMVTLALLVWGYAILLNLLPITTNSAEVTIWIYGLIRPVSVFVSWSGMTVLYSVLFYKVWKNTHAAAVRRPDADCDTPSSGSGSVHSRRLLAMFIVIPVVSFVCWMPYSVVRVTAFIDPNHFFAHNLDIAYWFSGSLYCISAALNPLIYWGGLDGLGQGVYARLDDDNELEVDTEVVSEQPAVNTLMFEQATG